MKIYTIGYGGRSQDDFLKLVRDAGVRTIVDIRLRPDRASMGIWMKAKTPDRGIERWLGQAGLSYRSLVELGNVFVDQNDWHEQYQQLLDGAGEVLVRRLLEVPGPVCLLCAEKRVSDCHRRQVANYLAASHQAVIQHLE